MTAPGIASLPFRMVLGATALGFGGFALLVPLVPLWVAGAGELAAGSTTGVLMLVTIATQGAVPRLAVRFGWRAVVAAGLVLIGAPAPLYALSADLAPVLAVTAVRGVGFGLLTVAGSALVAELVPRAEHGRAAARYGLAIGVPQLAFVPSGVLLVDGFGFTAVFVVGGVLPLAGLLFVPALRVPRPAPTPPRDRSLPRPPGSAGPVLTMLACSVAQGGLVTFLPLAVPGSGAVVAVALFVTSAGALLGRVAAGRLVDRHGMGGRLLRPGALLAAAGMVGQAVAAAAGGNGVLVAAAGAAVGFGFGLVQNDALTTLFAAAGPARYGSASAAWNMSYDAGTGLGAVGMGALAQQFGFPTAFGAAAVLLVGAASTVRSGRRSGSRASVRPWPAGRRR